MTMLDRAATATKLTSISPTANTQVRPRNISAPMPAERMMLSTLSAEPKEGAIRLNTMTISTSAAGRPKER